MFKKLSLMFFVLIFGGFLFAQSAAELESWAPQALKNKEFVLYFQPICKFSKKKVCGAEALIRWQRDGKLIAPYKFIPLFENNGFIKQIDIFVVESVLKYLQTWQEKGLKTGFISLNISALELAEENFLPQIKTLLEKYKIDTKQIIIEITETTEIKNKQKALAFILGLKELGFNVAIDDLGDGYATVENMQNYPYTVVKLSKELLKDFENKQTKTELKQTIKTVKFLPVKIIAEGIENKKEATFLKNQGADFAQGYLYYKPMPAGEFEKLLSSKELKYCKL